MRRSVAVFLSLLALVCAGQFSGCSKGPLEVTPTPARPGQKIHLHQDNGRFLSYQSPRAMIGSQPAYVRFDGNNDADVMVPINVRPGRLPLRLLDGRQVKASAHLVVDVPDCVQLVMEIQGGIVQILRAEFCRGAVDGDVPSRAERLSFDLVDSNGQVVHTSSILHPLHEGAEVFSRAGSSATVSRAPAGSQAVFRVRLPYLPDARDLLVYDAAGGLNLADSTGRANRVLLETVEVRAHR